MGNSRHDLLRAILIDPYDDTPRLIYADWLEEHGEAGRARWIRESIEHKQSSTGANNWWVYRRGFAEEIMVDMALFLEVIEQPTSWFRDKPITKVTITDKQPGRSLITGLTHGRQVYGWRWWNFASNECDMAREVLPKEIIVRLCGSDLSGVHYYNEADAMADLSQALVAYGRELAGLPPLPRISPITAAARS